MVAGAGLDKKEKRRPSALVYKKELFMKSWARRATNCFGINLIILEFYIWFRYGDLSVFDF